jgi:hypothetical protein
MTGMNNLFLSAEKIQRKELGVGAHRLKFNTAAREAQISYEDKDSLLIINMAFAKTHKPNPIEGGTHGRTRTRKCLPSARA